MNITILGSGAFGLAIAKCFFIKQHKITIWSKFTSEVNTLKNQYQEYKFTTNMKDATTNTDIIIIAIPIEFFYNTIIELKEVYQQGIILIASKGIEKTTQKFAYQMIENILPNIPYGILSGGTFAKDMLDEKIMGITLASTSNKVINITKESLKNSFLIIEKSNDITGVSICGAAKNIIAIAFGILDGANYPESSKFLFLTEAILEIKNLIIKLGGQESTILSYAGIDDIMMTCTSSKSRNYTFGKMIGQNTPLDQIEEYKKNNTIEGLGTTFSFYTLLQKKKIESPLINIIYNILYQNANIQELIQQLKKINKNY